MLDKVSLFSTLSLTRLQKTLKRCYSMVHIINLHFKRKVQSFSYIVLYTYTLHTYLGLRVGCILHVNSSKGSWIDNGHIFRFSFSINPKMGAWPYAGGCCNCVVTPVLNRFKSIWLPAHPDHFHQQTEKIVELQTIIRQCFVFTMQSQGRPLLGPSPVESTC